MKGNKNRIADIKLAFFITGMFFQENNYSPNLQFKSFRNKIGIATQLAIPILLKIRASSLTNAMLMSRCAFSITFAASATLIDAAL